MELFKTSYKYCWEVLKPAQDLLEIVPTDSNLIVEVKILPKDIAFIYQGQKLLLNFQHLISLFWWT